MHHILLPHHHQTHRNVLIQICYATLSKLEAKYMKASHSRAWVCKPFIHIFMIFRLTENMEMILQSHTSYFTSWEPNILSKAQAPLQQVRPQHESVGEWRRRNERIGRLMNSIVWTFNLQLKLLH